MRACLFGIAPGGGYRAGASRDVRGALLPHRFTLTWSPDLRPKPSAVCFLLPCSACCHGWPLAITLPCGVRTFLALFGRNRRGRDCLARFAASIL